MFCVPCLLSLCIFSRLIAKAIYNKLIESLFTVLSFCCFNSILLMYTLSRETLENFGISGIIFFLVRATTTSILFEVTVLLRNMLGEKNKIRRLGTSFFVIFKANLKADKADNYKESLWVHLGQTLQVV